MGRVVKARSKNRRDQEKGPAFGDANVGYRAPKRPRQDESFISAYACEKRKVD